MTHSLADSTREAFAARAGLECKSGSVIATNGCFYVTTADGGQYRAYFQRNNVPVEYFDSPTLERALTREEARDLLTIIKTCAPRDIIRTHGDTITRLEQNLPALGFDTPTPLMTAAAPRTGAGNAKLWTWRLNNE